ncbi:MAG: hypothetical protein HYZ09_00385 [Candidatus Kerfeldbacteria bacterium]|nr:hypothetical protein [Candidatus Kerfeldbacteria bacterium]
MRPRFPKDPLHQTAKRIARSQGFHLGSCIYEGWSHFRTVRNVIYAGTFRGRDSVLKVFDDPRIIYEVLEHRAFLAHNRSRLLTAPALYASQQTSPHTGWLVMERIPAAFRHFDSPLKARDRADFLRAFEEYRRIFPKRPTRPLMLVERLSSVEYHRLRIDRWMDLANSAEEQRQLTGRRPLLAPREFLPRFRRALRLMDRTFRARRQVWSHGHVKPKEFFTNAQRTRFYLTDFAHAKYYPEGYDFALPIWADWLIGGNWRWPYRQWRKGVFTWIDDFVPVAQRLGVRGFRSLMRGAIAERTLGSLLADIPSAQSMSEREQRRRIRLLYRLLDELTGR